MPHNHRPWQDTSRLVSNRTYVPPAHRLIPVERHSRLFQGSCIEHASQERRRESATSFTPEEEGNVKREMKIGMALTRRRQPRKAVGTQILCKRTRAGNASSCLYSISDEYRASSYRARTTTYVYVYAIGVYARGNWLSTLPGATTVRRATRQPGMWVTVS